MANLIDYPLPASDAWTRISSDHSGQSGERLLVDLSGQSLTLTLPGSPSSDGTAWLALVIIAGDGSNELTVARNGNAIQGTSEDLVVAGDKGRCLTLIYTPSDLGWAALDCVADPTRTRPPAGEMGPQGPSGESGRKGATGLMGEAGPQGDKDNQGKPGDGVKKITFGHAGQLETVYDDADETEKKTNPLPLPRRMIAHE